MQGSLLAFADRIPLRPTAAFDDSLRQKFHSGRSEMRNASVVTCAIALLTTVGTASAQDWTKSKWGPNDEIGAANYMTPELVMKAAQLVKTGKVYALGIPVDSSTPAFPPRTFKIT